MNTTFPILCNASLPGAIYLSVPPPIPPGYLQVTAAVVYTLLSILTVGGNALVVLIVFHYMGIATVTNLFISNLALTDLFIGVFCIPIVLVSDFLLLDWPFGLFMCKFTSFAQSVFVVCTVYTLLAMSIDRYIAIIYPLHPKLTRKQCHLTIALLWLFSILFSCPIFVEMHILHTCFHRNAREETQTLCRSHGLPPRVQTIYNIASLAVIYWIPLCLLSIIYIRLGWQLNRSQAPGEAHSERDAKIKKSKQKVIKMCFIVVIMFGVCWLPIQLYTNILRPHLAQIFKQQYLPHFYLAFHLMAMSNSCVNPFIYGVMSSKFRAGYAHYARRLLTCCGSLNEHWKPKVNLTETTILTASFRRERRSSRMEQTVQLKRLSIQNKSISPLLLSQRDSSYA